MEKSRPTTHQTKKKESVVVVAGVHTGSAQPPETGEKERERKKTTGRERDDKIASFRSTPAGPNAILKERG